MRARSVYEVATKIFVSRKPENNSIGNKDLNEKSGAKWWYEKYFRTI